MGNPFLASDLDENGTGKVNINFQPYTVGTPGGGGSEEMKRHMKMCLGKNGQTARYNNWAVIHGMYIRPTAPAGGGEEENEQSHDT